MLPTASLSPLTPTSSLPDEPSYQARAFSETLGSDNLRPVRGLEGGIDYQSDAEPPASSRPQTPPRNTNLTVTDHNLTQSHHTSPRFVKASHTSHHSESNMTVNRDNIIKDEGPGVPIVSLDFFQRAMLPHTGITEGGMESIFTNMKSLGAWNETTRRWPHFKNDPMNISGNENVVFSRMKDVIDSILKAAAGVVPDRSASSSYQSNPNKPSHSGTYNSNYQSDGNFILEPNSSRGYPGEYLEPGKSTLVFNVVALLEYKKHISSKNIQDVSAFNRSWLTGPRLI